jgi:hypothetical protein
MMADGGLTYDKTADRLTTVNASTTIPKTYSANTFTGLQTFGNASTTLLSSSYHHTFGRVLDPSHRFPVIHRRRSRRRPERRG